VLAGRDRSARGRRVRAPRDPRQQLRAARRDRALPEPQRTRGDDRGDRGVPLSEDPLHERAEDLYEEAPCGYLSTRPDGTIVKVNRTFLDWTGFSREELLGSRRFADLLTAGGRIYHETHFAPLLALQGSVREVALEIRCADRSRLPVLVNSVLRAGDDDRPAVVRTTVFNATDRQGYERELRLARERAEQLRQQMAEIAHVLQRSLLQGVPLDDPRLRIGAHYQPSVETLEVGGDWHDAFPLDGDRIGLVVGDVVGRGIEAAAAMGQLRSATRALADAGLGGPGHVLAALDRFATGLPLARMATLVYAEVELAGGTVRYACAGHPPPVLVAADGSARLLWDGRRLPLGIAPSSDPAVEGSTTLGREDQLLLYTDGLVERRSESLDDGLARLVEQLADARADAPQETVDRLVAALAEAGQHPDDVCVLSVAVDGGGPAPAVGT
jgi:PAS domain S-box-containing protein